MIRQRDSSFGNGDILPFINFGTSDNNIANSRSQSNADRYRLHQCELGLTVID